MSSPTSSATTRVVSAGLAAVVAVSAYNAALAFPDGAPWGAADPNAAENCATCHFDGEPVRNSKALSIEGLPERLSPDTLYELILRFENPDGAVAGFQILAWAGGQTAGTFASRAEHTEAVGAAIRSTAAVGNDGTVSWTVKWRTPHTVELPAVIHAAVLAANDDQSPLGDEVHFRSYEYPEP